MDMDDDDQLVLAWLEEQMLDVREKNVNTMLRVEWRLITDTVLMDFDLARNSFTFHRWPNVDIIKDGRAAF